MANKYLPAAFVVSAGVAFGVFMFAPVSKTLYINNKSSFLAVADINQTTNQPTDKLGDFSNTLIPSISIPKNITENFAGILAKDLISKNSEPKTDSSGQPALTVPDVNAMTEKFVADGLKQANENLLNIQPPNLKISPDNSKAAIQNYLSEFQTIINDNLKKGDALFPILEEINKNNGAGLEKLLPIISAHETAANQLEEKPVPSDLKNLMTEEIKLLRITANVFRAMTNIKDDPLGGVVAIRQFNAVIKMWGDLQIKMDSFLKNFNRA